MKTFSSLLSVLSLAFLCGCGGQPTNNSSGPLTTPPPNTVDVHNHPEHGPHGGELVELGNEEYHAELLHDTTSVTVYILSGDASKTVPIDAKELKINVTHEGKPEQFKLVAEPDQGDPRGQSTRFISKDAELAEHVGDEKSQAKLVVTIASKTYRGDVVHDHAHSHEGHTHK